MGFLAWSAIAFILAVACYFLKLPELFWRVPLIAAVVLFIAFFVSLLVKKLQAGDPS